MPVGVGCGSFSTAAAGLSGSDFGGGLNRHHASTALEQDSARRIKMILWRDINSLGCQKRSDAHLKSASRSWSGRRQQDIKQFDATHSHTALANGDRSG